MRRRNSQYTVPKWIKWGLLGFLLLLILCFIYLFSLYNDIQQTKTANFQVSKEKVLESTNVTQIEKVTKYNGENQFHVIFGTTKDGSEKIIFVPLNNKNSTQDLPVIDRSKIISKQQIKEQWATKCQSCELIDITPAMESNKPLWEVTYVDSLGRYIFDYLSIFDGTLFQQYRLKSIFH